jgi:hypothetical protein
MSKSKNREIDYYGDPQKQKKRRDERRRQDQEVKEPEPRRTR